MQDREKKKKLGAHFGQADRNILVDDISDLAGLLAHFQLKLFCRFHFGIDLIIDFLLSRN